MELSTIEKGQQLEKLRADYKAKYDGYPEKTLPDGTVSKVIPANDLEEMVKMQKDIDELGLAYNAERNAEMFAKRNAEALEDGQKVARQVPGVAENKSIASQKSIGEQIVESPFFKKGLENFKNAGEMSFPDVSLKTLFQTSAGWAPESVRSGMVTLDPQAKPRVITALPYIPISQPVSKYMRETTFTNAAAAVAEDGAISAAALALTEITETVQKHAVYLPFTDEQLEDVEGAAAYINARLGLMVMQKLDSEAMNGNGSSPRIHGLLAFSGIQTQAKGAYTYWDALLLAFTDVRTAGSSVNALGDAEPSALMINPADWFKIITEKTSDGIYLHGNPSERQMETAWGIPVIQTGTLTAGTAITGDFAQYTAFRSYKGLTLKVSDSDQDDFIHGAQKIRAQVRACVDCYRPLALVKITGL